MTITHIQSETGDMVFDDTHAPIFFTNNRGSWNPGQVEKWYQVRTDAFLKSIKRGHKVFHVGNLSTSATPDAVMRKKIAELQAEYDVHFMDKQTWIGQCFIIPNPIMRGFITAVQWMTGGIAAPASTAASLDAALKIAETAYSKYALDLPHVPRDYKFPELEGDLPRSGIGRNQFKIVEYK